MSEGLTALVVLVLVLCAIGGTLWFLRKRIAIVGEFLAFLIERKLWWMTPIIIVLLMLGAVIIFTSNAAVAPFIYTLF